MKRLLLIILLFTSCEGNTNSVANRTISYQTQVEEVQPDIFLSGIQSKIYNAFVQSLMTKEDTNLLELSNRLKKLNETEQQKIIMYWQSYLQFYCSLFYLKNGDKKRAEKEIDQGIEWLDKMKNKNSEDYALLALLQSFGIQFKGMRAMFISDEINKNAKLAIANDSTNLRAYYVYGSNDFYTPVKYGGGKEAEKYLLKAISLPAQKVKNEFLPSWGKEESYELLIRYYIGNEKWDLAKKYFQEAIKEYPESHTINQLATKLVGK